MNPVVYLRPEAEQDIEDAAIWYDSQKKGLGSNFLDNILEAISLIAENPKLFPVLLDNTHRVIIKRFPFAVYYLLEKNRIIIIAVLHGSRHPNRWKERIGE